jgi:alginate O-acetyltransferase complex protein AlgI
MTPTAPLFAAVAWALLAGAASWLLRPTWRTCALIAAGAGALAILSWPSLICLAAATAATYRIGRLRAHRVTAGVAAIALIAGAYLVLLWRSGSIPADDTLRIVLPLGMAYYVLRLIHYLIEVDRDGFRAHRLTDYAAYQFFPATLAVGPIHRFDVFLRDLRRRRWDSQLASWGASRVLGGLLKIVLLGNLLLHQRLAPAVAAADLGGFERIYADTVVYWLNVYVQFSGYSSVAVGLGAILGFEVPENFNWPFLARNIGEFWRRWHMTLSGWCRDYIYTPALAAWRMPLAASAASMIVLGVWHEVSLHYVLWGLYHALGLTAWRRFDAVYTPLAARLPRPVLIGWAGFARILTVHFVMFSYPTANAIERLVLHT